MWSHRYVITRKSGLKKNSKECRSHKPYSNFLVGDERQSDEKECD